MLRFAAEPNNKKRVINPGCGRSWPGVGALQCFVRQMDGGRRKAGAAGSREGTGLRPSPPHHVHAGKTKHPFSLCIPVPTIPVSHVEKKRPHEMKGLAQGRASSSQWGRLPGAGPLQRQEVQSLP